MTYWVRLWDDMPNDPKWRVIAKRSGRPISEVTVVFLHMLINAGANAKERGVLVNWCDEDIAASMDIEPENVTAIREAMEGKVLEGLKLTGWEKRQPKREDNSTERVQAHRKRNETQMERTVTQCNAPDADADADAEQKKELVASGDAGLFEISSEKKIPTPKSLGLANKFFDEFWQAYPKRIGANPKETARKSYLKATEKEISPAELLEAVKRFAASPDVSDAKFIPMASTWLNQKRWQQYQTPVSQNGNSSGSVTPISAAPALQKTKVPINDKDYHTLNRLYRVMNNWHIPMTTNSGTYFPTAWLEANREGCRAKLQELSTGEKAQAI